MDTEHRLMTPAESSAVERTNLQPWATRTFPDWKIELFNRWFVPRADDAHNHFAGRSVRSPGT
jgi:hypothetical protein